MIASDVWPVAMFVFNCFFFSSLYSCNDDDDADDVDDNDHDHDDDDAE